MLAGFGPIYRLLLRNTLSRARLLALAGLGLIGVVIGAAIGLSDPADSLDAGTTFVNAFSLSLLAPVVSLVIAAAALGEPHHDGTLVYLWLRPVRRSVTALAGYAASLTIVVPLVLGPTLVGALLTGAGGRLLGAATVASALAVAVYCAVFVPLGLRAERALAWGLGYILIWEGFVASAGDNASRVALRAYTRSVLSQLTDVELPIANSSVATSLIVTGLVAIVAIAYTSRRLRRQDIA